MTYESNNSERVRTLDNIGTVDLSCELDNTHTDFPTLGSLFSR